MGRASSTKARRRDAEARHRPTTAHIEVVTPGMLEILSIGRGDIKLSVDPGNKGDVAKAKKMIADMMKAGYGIFVEVEEDGETKLARVKRFDPAHMTYVISELAEPDPEPTKAPRTPRRTRERHVPVAGSRAKAIGRTAGG